MALIKCKECNKEVSNTAGKCPHCGAKVAKPLGVAGWLLVVFTAFVVYQCSSIANNPKNQTTTVIDPKEDARFQKTATIARLIKSNLREPKSMTLELALANDDASVICIEYRAKNGFGGMNHEFVVFANGKASQDANAWNKHCIKPLHNMMYVKHALP